MTWRIARQRKKQEPLSAWLEKSANYWDVHVDQWPFERAVCCKLRRHDKTCCEFTELPTVVMFERLAHLRGSTRLSTAWFCRPNVSRSLRRFISNRPTSDALTVTWGRQYPENIDWVVKNIREVYGFQTALLLENNWPEQAWSNERLCDFVLETAMSSSAF